MQFDLQRRICKAARRAQQSNDPGLSPWQKFAKWWSGPVSARTIQPDEVVMANAAVEPQRTQRRRTVPGNFEASRYRQSAVLLQCPDSPELPELDLSSLPDLTGVVEPGAALLDDDLRTMLMLENYERSLDNRDECRSAGAFGSAGEKATICEALSPSVGTSCHQCKSRRDPTELVQCNNPQVVKISLKSMARRSCKKKYCVPCLDRFYGGCSAHIVHYPDGLTAWVCPFCQGRCCCAQCKRQKVKKRRATEDPRGYYDMTSSPDFVSAIGDLVAVDDYTDTFITFR